MRPSPLLAALWFVGLAWTVPPGLHAQQPELLPLPPAAYEQLEPASREQLEGTRAALEALEATRPTAARLAAAYGELGQLYFVYDFTEAAEVAWRNAATLDPESFEWQYYLGVVLRQDGDLEAARAALERALALADGRSDAERAAAHFRLGEVLAGLDPTAPDVRSRFERVLELDPNHVGARMELGRLAQREGAPEAALELFEQALEAAPDASILHFHIGTALRSLGRLEEARARLALNTHRAPQNPDPLVESLTTLVQGAQWHAKAGIEALRVENYAGAVEHFRRSLEIDTSDPVTHYNLGVAHRELGEAEAAWSAFEAALERRPDHRDAHFNLARLAVARGDLGRAETHFRRVHEIDPEDHRAHREWAVALARTGQAERALGELEALALKAPNFTEARVSWSALAAELGDLDTAVRVLEETLKGDVAGQERAAVHQRLAQLFERSERQSDALLHYRNALEWAPDAEQPRLSMASLFVRRAQWDAAERQFVELIERSPENPQFRVGRATILLLRGDQAAAFAVLEEGLEAVPGAPVLQRTLARLLATSPSDQVIDPERSVSLARGLYDDQGSLDHAETLALALAAVGRFAEAVDLQALVVDRLETSQDPSAARSRRFLESFQAEQSVRGAWREVG